MGDRYYPEEHREDKRHNGHGDLTVLGIPIIGFGGCGSEHEEDWTVGVASAYGPGSEHFEQKHNHGGGGLRILGIPIIGVQGEGHDYDVEVTTPLPRGYVAVPPPYPTYEQYVPPPQPALQAPDWDESAPQGAAPRQAIPQGDAGARPCPTDNSANSGYDTPSCDAPATRLESRQLHVIPHDGPCGRISISDVLKHDPKSGKDQRASVLQFESGERLEAREDGIHVFGKDGTEVCLKPTKKDGLYVSVKADGSVDVDGHKNRIRLRVDKASGSMALEYSNGTKITADASGFTSAVETRELGV
jgi:hypothetical protein